MPTVASSMCVLLGETENKEFYCEQKFQLRAHMYQARSLIGSDASGLSDPFARVICGEFCKSTQVIDETLSPTWDELLLFDDILIYGTDEEIKKDPPSIVIELFDQDKVVCHDGEFSRHKLCRVFSCDTIAT